MENPVKALIVFCCLFFLTWSNHSAYAQSLYDFHFWNSSDGLPQNSVNSITQDSTGFIWFTTYDGIVRFDGKVFKVFNVKNSPVLTTNRWNRVMKGQGNELYFFSYEGFIAHRKDGEFIVYSIPAENYFFNASFYDSSCGAVFGRGVKISKLVGGDIEPVFEIPDSFDISRISAVVKDPDTDVIYIGGYDAKSIYQYDLQTENFTSILDINGVVTNLIFQRGQLLIVERKKITVFEKGKDVFTIPLPDETLDANSYAVLEDELILSLNSSLFVYNLNSGDTYTFSPQEAGKRFSLQNVFVDRDQTIWGGTTTEGFFLARKNVFRFYDGFVNTGGKGVNPVFFDSKNRILAGLSCAGIAYIDTNNEVTVRKEIDFQDSVTGFHPEVTPNCVYSIFEDDRGDFWYGTSNFGLFIERSTGELEFYLDEMNRPSVKAIQQFGDYVYVGHAGGFSMYDLINERFVSIEKFYSNTGLLKGKFINYFYKLKNGAIIVGTEKSGAFVLGSDQKIKQFANTHDLDVPNVRAVYQDSLGNVWMGTYGNGLLFKGQDADTVAIISDVDGLYDNVVSAIVEDGSSLYMTCNKGLFRVSIADLYGFLRGEKSRIYSEYFGSSPQFEQIEFNGGFQQTFARTNRGTILFPSFRGVVEFRPRSLSKILTPQITFEDVTVNGKEVSPDELNLRHNFFSVSFRVSAPSFAFSQNLVLEYKLKGFNEDWQNLRPDHIVEYNRLPPGDYVLEVRVRHLSNEAEDYNRAELGFSVDSPFWKRPGNMAGAGVLLLLLALIWFYLEKRKSRVKARRISQLLKEKTQSLRETKANLEAVINNTDELIWCVDADYKLLVANDVYLNVHFKRYGEKLLRGQSIFKNAPRDVRDFWIPHFTKTLKGKKSTLQVKGKSRSGREIMNEVAFYPIYKGEEIAGLVGFTKEITSIKQREEQLKNAMQIANDAAKSKSEFLATMSHEIRTPINAVIGMTSLLQHTRLNSEQSDYVRNIRFGGETLLQIINDILDFSKGEANKLTLEDYEFNIRESILNTVSLIEDKAVKRGIKITRNIEWSVPGFAIADESKLRQVLLNLLSNAVKFTDEGEITIKCDWQDLESDSGNFGKLIFTVSDTGIGIPKHKLNSLFTPFVQVDAGTNRKYGGTGLGLAISRKIVERMGGAISVSSEEGKGTSFEFYVECEAVDDKDKIANDDMQNDPIVLRVKDEKRRKKIERILVQSGFSIILHHEYAGKNSILITDEIQFTKDVEHVIFISENSYEDDDQRYGFQFVSDFELESKVSYCLNRLIKKFQDTKQHLNRKDNVLNGLNILVAEDNPVNQKLVQMILRKLGLTCDVAANGLEVLDALERNQYNFVYMDCQMPEMDGFEATSFIRKRFDSSDVIIVAMTANAMKEDRLRCLDAGMDDYLPKPIDLETIEKNLIKWSKKITKKQ